MNVYDFDRTIYSGDSTIDFYLFCIKRKPYILLRYSLKQLCGFLLFFLHMIDKNKVKEYYFSFLFSIQDLEGMVNDFWNQNEKKINEWYLLQQKENDVIISASPYFLLQEICQRMNKINLIATDLDTNNIKICGCNCKGKEKVRRFYERFSEEKIESFYSDSLSDQPLAEISQKAFLVKRNKICDWPFS